VARRLYVTPAAPRVHVAEAGKMDSTLFTGIIPTLSLHLSCVVCAIYKAYIISLSVYCSCLTIIVIVLLYSVCHRKAARRCIQC
jgi:hypothetical protein